MIFLNGRLSLWHISCSFARVLKPTLTSRLFLLYNSKKTYRQHLKNQALLYQRIALLCFLLYTPFFSQAQQPDSTGIIADSIYQLDSIGHDSLEFSIDKHVSDLDVALDYEADDSIILDMPSRKAYLYGNAKIKYQEINIAAHYI